MEYQEPEETLTRQFMPWFIKTREYIETYEDIDTSGGDPVDSAGSIDSKVVLIEFKHSISPREVRYSGSGGGSIEKKIRTVLKNLYHDQNDRITRSLRGIDLDHEPLFILVVNRLSANVLGLLRQMLVELRPQWRFGYEIIRWNNDHGETLEYSSPQPVSEDLLTSIQFPAMPSTAPKRLGGQMSIADCCAIMKSEGLDSLMVTMLEKVQEFGGRKVGGSKNNVNFSFPPKVTRAALGIWPNDSDAQNGVFISYKLSKLQERFGRPITEETLPGIRAPRKGHLDASRFLKSRSEIVRFRESIHYEMRQSAF